jgi:hypothetical protein
MFVVSVMISLIHLHLNTSFPLPPQQVQFGLAADPLLTAQWWQNFIPDEAPAATNMSNTIGTIAMAADAQQLNNRAAMLYINMDNNSFLDSQRYTPLGQLLNPQAALEVLRALDDRWGELIYIPSVGTFGG